MRVLPPPPAKLALSVVVPPEQTFARINVEGTRNVLQEARRAGVRRLVYMSSLGAERGQSAYHQSKFRGEEAVRSFAGEWTILRPGNVYGVAFNSNALTSFAR